MIAVIGGCGIGLTMRVDRAPHAGETVTGGVLTSGPGGKGSNQAIGMSRLGADVALFTAVGADAAAAELDALWSAETVDASAVVHAPGATMTGFILVDSAGENRIAIAPGALAQLTSTDLSGFLATIATADLLVVSLEVPLAVARLALDHARATGTRSVLNPAPAWPLSDGDVPLADVITPNASEARVLLGIDTDDDGHGDEQLATRLATRLQCDVVLTLGAHGAVVVERGAVERIEPCAPAAVVDTTGAGDAFTAALSVALVEGAALADAARWAATAGAHAVAIAEVIPALPRRSELGPIRTSTQETA